MFSSIFHTTPEVKSLVGGLLLICVADGMPEEVDPASTLYWTLVVCLLPTFLQHCSSQFQEHLVMPPSEPILCQCCSAAQQNMLEWGIDGPTEFAGLLCTKPLMEVFRAQKGVVCCPNEEAEPVAVARTLLSWLLGSRHPPKLTAAPVLQTSLWAPPAKSWWPLQQQGPSSPSCLPWILGWVARSIWGLPALSGPCPRFVYVAVFPSSSAPPP